MAKQVETLLKLQEEKPAEFIRTLELSELLLASGAGGPTGMDGSL